MTNNRFWEVTLRHSKHCALSSPRGFTLVELLIGIFVVAVLAALSTIELNNARTRTQDTQVKENVIELRNLADTHFSENNASYAGFDRCVFGYMNPAQVTECKGGVATSVTTLVDDSLATNGVSKGVLAHVGSDGESACVTAALPSDSSQWFCVDFMGDPGIIQVDNLSITNTGDCRSNCQATTSKNL